MSRRPLALINDPSQFPPTRASLTSPNGLLAASYEINSAWLAASYPKGIFPWYSPGEPVLWWTPNPRTVLFVDNFKYRRSLQKKIRSLSKTGEHRITINRDFEHVIRACAIPRDNGGGTWITEEIIQSYLAFHREGFAHSVEHWKGDQLIGGLYCVSIGRMVFGESMFSTETDASKIAFAHFIQWLANRQVRIIDCQQATRHLLSLGAVEISRDQFEQELQHECELAPLDWSTGQLDWLE